MKLRCDECRNTKDGTMRGCFLYGDIGRSSFSEPDQYTFWYFLTQYNPVDEKVN